MSTEETSREKPEGVEVTGDLIAELANLMKVPSSSPGFALPRGSFRLPEALPTSPKALPGLSVEQRSHKVDELFSELNRLWKSTKIVDL